MNSRQLAGFVLAIACAWMPTAGRADEFKPAYLQVTAVAGTPGDYDVLWRRPALDESVLLSLAPEFPAGTREFSPRVTYYAAGAAVQRWRLSIDGGLDGKAVTLRGRAASRIDALVRYVRADGTEQLGRVTPLEDRFRFTASPGGFEVARTYTTLGIEHILLGFDHLLFVLSLVILVDGLRRLFWAITAFTAAHSITLAAATLGFVHVPGPPVEAAIALSIVFVAAEILRKSQRRASLGQRHTWVIAFSFGLLHGLGFAGALAQVGLPQNSIPLALFFFNVGVEIGQIVFVAAVLAVLFVGRSFAARLRIASPTWMRLLPPYVIGSIAALWTVERVSSFAHG